MHRAWFVRPIAQLFVQAHVYEAHRNEFLNYSVVDDTSFSVYGEMARAE